MIPWFQNTISITKYAESGKFIIIEQRGRVSRMDARIGTIYKVLEQTAPENYNVRFAGRLVKCVNWANEHGAKFIIYSAEGVNDNAES